MEEKELKQLLKLLKQFKDYTHINYKEDVDVVEQYVKGAIAQKKYGY